MITKVATLSDGSTFLIEDAYEGSSLPIYINFETEDGEVNRYFSNEDVLKIKSTIFEYLLTKGKSTKEPVALMSTTEPELELHFS